MNRWLRHTSSLACTFALLSCSGEETHAATTSNHQAASRPSEPVEAFQTELLRMAFRATEKFPLDPQIKNRCREREEVVSAALQLGSTELALEFTRQIENWRKGACYALVARELVEQGKTANVEGYLDQALASISAESGATGQAWRVDRVRALVAVVKAMLGDDAKAHELAATIDTDAQREVLVVDEARTLRDEDFDKALRQVDAVCKSGSFEPVTAQLRKCVRLYDRYFADTERRAALEERICRAALKSTPAMVRVELLTDSARVAAMHGDRAKAEELIGLASDLMAETPKWNPEHRLPLDAAIAEALHLAGATDKARERLAAAIDYFDANKQFVINMFRGNALRPIAEAYHAIGDEQASIDLYAKILDEAFVNPNARPRAMDFIATCCSLAVHHIEPTAELRQRLNGIVDEELDSPW
ncbi:MAG: hypothetical protein KDB80_13930 [Planctomycetes bacterium]|nr:hypothetical protein [Planctomycetota bacterium]